MLQSDITRKIIRSSHAAVLEKLPSPQMVQKTKAVRYPSGRLRVAYCKTDAGAATTIVCYLDKDDTGIEITVNCSIAGGGNLDAAVPRLTDGLLILVTKIDATWWCTTIFMRSCISDASCT